MGGWVALLLAQARPERTAGLVLVNPAADFTDRLMWPPLQDHVRQAVLRDGRAEIEEPGLGRYALTRRMFEEARDWMVLDADLDLTCPIHVLQGRRDDVVPWSHQLALLERLPRASVRLELVPDGDHRLSTPADLGRLVEVVSEMRGV
jgi:pimeloyl-ACP methyl ester carboxylesterase